MTQTATSETNTVADTLTSTDQTQPTNTEVIKNQQVTDSQTSSMKTKIRKILAISRKVTSTLTITKTTRIIALEGTIATTISTLTNINKNRDREIRHTINIDMDTEQNIFILLF